MIKLSKINNEEVTPIKVPFLDPKRIRGYNIIPELYSNIYICAKKKSGKTNCIFKILKSCVGKDTSLIFFASTIHKDKNLMHIVKYFKKKGNNVETFTSIVEEKVDRLKELLNSMTGYDDDDDEIKEKDKIKLAYLELEEASVKKVRKPKKLSADVIFIFDDLGTEMRIKSVNKLLKTNRHYRSKAILSGQNLKDLMPEAIRQMDIILLFQGHNEETIHKIFENANINISFELLWKIYQQATEQRFNFLYIDTIDNQFRKNFNYIFEI